MNIIEEESSHAKDITAVLRQTGFDVDDRAADLIDELRSENARLRQLIDDHNVNCQAACGDGDMEAQRCGWRSYFEHNGRRCSTCPVYDKIDYSVPNSETSLSNKG